MSKAVCPDCGQPRDMYKGAVHICPAHSVISVSLTRVKHAIEERIPRSRIAGLVGYAEWDHYLDALVVRLEKDLWSERLADETVKWPSTWWDAFKLRWFPSWLKRHYPIQWSHADFAIYRGCPDVVMPDRQSVLFSQRIYDLDKP